jgi:16S rRNA (guanine527-N7)-methyltransferase
MCAPVSYSKQQDMDTARVATLLAPFLARPLSRSQLDQISTYIDLLRRWNARMNLTAIRNEEEIVTRHFGESLFLAGHVLRDDSAESDSEPTLPGARSPLRLGGAFRVADIGSGAGFPAIPLKIWSPEIELTLIESNHKKATFLREVSRALALRGVEVVTERAEALAAEPLFPRTQLVTLRAVEHFESILPLAETLLAPDGTLALLIGSAQIPALSLSTRVNWNEPIRVPQSDARVLSIGVRRG